MLVQHRVDGGGVPVFRVEEEAVHVEEAGADRGRGTERGHCGRIGKEIGGEEEGGGRKVFDMEWGLAGEGLRVEKGIGYSLLDFVFDID